MRKLVHTKPQAFIDLLVDQLGSQRRVRFTGEHLRPEKLRDSSFEIDTLINVTVDEQEDSLIHFEWQTYYDRTMANRLLRYNVLIRCELDLPVHSCVWHLLKDSRIKPSPLHWTEPINGDVLEYHYTVIEVGDLLPEDIFSREEVVLLPFVPLTNGGATRRYVESMLDKLSGRGHEEFAFVGFTLMFNKAHRQADCEWLIERYRAMNSMIHDLLDEDPLYLAIKQKGLQEGLQEGRQEGLQQAVISLVVASFADLETLARAKVSAVNDMERLQQLIIDLHLSHTREQIERILLSLGN